MTKVWETMRGRVEAYPGHGDPNGYAPDVVHYGYDADPDYIYAPDAVGTEDGRVPPCHDAGSESVPWHNLDERSNWIRSGLSPDEPFPGQNVLLESKVNRNGYVYVASRGWYGRESLRMAARRTGNHVRTHFEPPLTAAAADDPTDVEYVSFPYDTMELKAAWRRLGRHDRHTRFLRSRVRYYADVDGRLCHVDSDGVGRGDDQWGMLALHIARKTPLAPFFVWATFEQVDVLVADAPDSEGYSVATENLDGSERLDLEIGSDYYSPPITPVAATEEADQYFAPDSMVPAAIPGLRLHFHQQPLFGIPEVRYVAVNRRMHAIAGEIRAVNRAAQRALRLHAPDSPLQYYRLVAVQWRPIDKKPGVPYVGPQPPSIYYAANVVIEAPPVHQAFSGQFTHGISLASDYLRRETRFRNPPPNPGDPVFYNTYHAGKAYLAGGCMGCHGVRQSYGTDWSFLLYRQRVQSPDKPDG